MPAGLITHPFLSSEERKACMEKKEGFANNGIRKKKWETRRSLVQIQAPLFTIPLFLVLFK
ncbi:MAG: hypothetical protein DRP27_09420 [Thermotogae bacterium]|nr:MAG: hypothetical protein DRP27_09420 [Thermotogota bacterium]